jgi:hypothetical protein
LTLIEDGKRSFLNITLVDILIMAIHIGIATKTPNLTSNSVSSADLPSKRVEFLSKRSTIYL